VKVTQGVDLAITYAMRTLDVIQGLCSVFHLVRVELVKAIETLRVKLNCSA
jgi:hypothetical protein